MKIKEIVFGFITGALFLGELNRNGWFFLSIFFGIVTVLFFISGIIIDLLIKIYLNSSPYEQRYYVRDVIVK